MHLYCKKLFSDFAVKVKVLWDLHFKMLKTFVDLENQLKGCWNQSSNLLSPNFLSFFFFCKNTKGTTHRNLCPACLVQIKIVQCLQSDFHHQKHQTLYKKKNKHKFSFKSNTLARRIFAICANEALQDCNDDKSLVINVN